MSNATNRWLDKLAEWDRRHGGTGTDYKLAQLLGEPGKPIKQKVSKWRASSDQIGRRQCAGARAADRGQPDEGHRRDSGRAVARRAHKEILDPGGEGVGGHCDRYRFAVRAVLPCGKRTVGE